MVGHITLALGLEGRRPHQMSQELRKRGMAIKQVVLWVNRATHARPTARAASPNVGGGMSLDLTAHARTAAAPKAKASTSTATPVTSPTIRHGRLRSHASRPACRASPATPKRPLHSIQRTTFAQ